MKTSARPSTVGAASASGERIGLGVSCAIIGFLGITVMDACAKFLGEAYAVSQIVLARNGVGALVILAFAVMRGGDWESLRPKRFGLLTLRTLFSLGAGFLFFISLRYLPLADAFTIAFTGPIFITALSVPILGEHVGGRRWAAVVIGFLGVLVVMQPGTDSFRAEGLLTLGAALCYALTMLVSRKMTRDMTTSAIIFWSSLGAALAALVLMPSQWQTPSPGDFALFVLLGVVGTLGMALVTQGYRYAPAAVIAPFDYFSLLWAVMLGWLIWKDVPEPHVWLGSFILIGSGLYILHRETRQLKGKTDDGHQERPRRYQDRRLHAWPGLGTGTSAGAEPRRGSRL